MGYQLQYISCSNGGSFNTTLAALPTVDSVITIQFLKTNSSQDFDLKFGVDYADICLRRSYHDLYWYPKNGWNVQNYLTINEVHTASVSNTQYTFDENTFTPTGSNVAIPSTANFRLEYFYGNLYGFNSIANSTYDFNLVPWINDNDVVGLMDLVSNTFYTPAGGTWTAGPRAHIFNPSKSSLTFPASGGSITFDVEAETTWTASTPTFATLSPSTGGTGTTTVTATCPSYTGTTKREETIIFTDNDSYTFDFKIRQRALTNGISNLYLGDNQIPTANAIYLGDAGVNTIYLGEEIVYSSGPFVGLKATKTLSFNPNQLTGTLKIKSSENWSLTDNSTVGSYYTLENYTTGCNGWVPTYDGSLDGGELGEYGLWFEWEYGVSDKPFQEWVDGLAAYGITATGSYCSGARYSIYLNPHATGGPGWLSYSQTTGGTGETIVTVTASTTQAARTAIITISSDNYTATTNVSQVVYLMPSNEVWYKTTDNNSMGLRYRSYYIGSTGQQLTYTESFDSESGLWKMVFNDDVYGNYESLYYNNNDRLVELWLPRNFIRPNAIFLYGQSHFEKFKGDSPSIVDNGNIVLDIKEGSDYYNWAVQGVRSNVTDIVVPNGVTVIQSYCFYQTTASTLTIPSTVTEVQDYSLERTVIDNIYCYGTTAPVFSSNAFWAVGNNGTLHYPAGSDYSSVSVPGSWTKIGDL